MGNWGDFTLLKGVITPFITGGRPPARMYIRFKYRKGFNVDIAQMFEGNKSGSNSMRFEKYKGSYPK